MAPIEVIALPSEKYRLEEINLSGHLLESLAGKTVPIEIVRGVMPMTRQLQANDYPTEGSFWIDRDGKWWNDYCPARVHFTEPQTSEDFIDEGGSGREKCLRTGRKNGSSGLWDSPET